MHIVSLVVHVVSRVKEKEELCLFSNSDFVGANPTHLSLPSKLTKFPVTSHHIKVQDLEEYRLTGVWRWKQKCQKSFFKWFSQPEKKALCETLRSIEERMKWQWKQLHPQPVTEIPFHRYGRPTYIVGTRWKIGEIPSCCKK